MANNNPIPPTSPPMKQIRERSPAKPWMHKFKPNEIFSAPPGVVDAVDVARAEQQLNTKPLVSHSAPTDAAVDKLKAEKKQLEDNLGIVQSKLDRVQTEKTALSSQLGKLKNEVEDLKTTIVEVRLEAEEAAQNVPEPEVMIKTEEVEILPEEMVVAKIQSLKKEGNVFVLGCIVSMEDEEYPTEMTLPFDPFQKFFQDSHQKSAQKRPGGKKGKKRY